MATIPRPLLDRFLEPAGPLSLESYSEIILRDVEALLSSRLSSPLGEEAGDDLGYGLADLSICGHGEGELARAAWAVRRCLESYEPRLCRIRVEVAGAAADSLTVRVEAALAGLEKAPALALEMPLRVRRE